MRGLLLIVLLSLICFSVQDFSGCQTVYFVDDFSIEPIPFAATASKSITVVDNVQINDVNLVSVLGFHPDMETLTMTLTSPGGTTATLFARPEGTESPAVCSNALGFSFSFDDTAHDTVATGGSCNLNSGRTIRPPGDPLQVFLGEMSGGMWTITFSDAAVGKGGQFFSAGLQINCDCHATYTSNTGIDTFTTTAGNPILSEIEIFDDVVVADVNLNVFFEAAAVDTITATLHPPDAPSRQIFSSICPGETNLVASFSDSATTGPICAMSGDSSKGLTWETPNLNTLAGEPNLVFSRAEGTWSLEVVSTTSARVRGWSLTLCHQAAQCDVVSASGDSRSVDSAPSTTVTTPVAISSSPIVVPGVFFDGGGFDRHWSIHSLTPVVSGTYDNKNVLAHYDIDLCFDATPNTFGGGDDMCITVHEATNAVGCRDGGTSNFEYWALVLDTNARSDFPVCDGRGISAYRPVDPLVAFDVDSFDHHIAYLSFSGGVGFGGQITDLSFAINCDNPCYHFFPSLTFSDFSFLGPSDEHQIQIGERGVVRDISLELSVDSTSGNVWDEIEVEIFAPGGESAVVLSGINCGSGSTQLRITLKDDVTVALDALADECDIFSAPERQGRTYRPDSGADLFAPLLGADVYGEWSVVVTDTLSARLVRINRAVLGICIDDSCPSRSYGGPPVALGGGSTSSTIRMAVRSWQKVHNVAITGLVIDVPGGDTSGLTVSLRSPDFFQTTVFIPPCAAASDSVVVNLHAYSRNAPSCGGVDSGATMQAIDLSQFEGRAMAGDWTLTINNGAAAAGTLVSWGLRFNCDCDDLFTVREPIVGVPALNTQFGDVFLHAQSLYADLHLSGPVQGTRASLSSNAGALHDFYTPGDNCRLTTELDLSFDGSLPAKLLSIEQSGFDMQRYPCPPNNGLTYGSADSEGSFTALPVKDDLLFDVTGSANIDAATLGMCLGTCRTYTTTEAVVFESTEAFCSGPCTSMASHSSPIYVPEPLPMGLLAGELPIIIAVDATGSGGSYSITLTSPFCECTLYTGAPAFGQTFVLNGAAGGPNGAIAASCCPGVTGPAEGLWNLVVTDSATVEIYSWSITFGCDQCLDWTVASGGDPLCAGARAPCGPYAFLFPVGGVGPFTGTTALPGSESDTINGIHVTAIKGDIGFAVDTITLEHDDSGTVVVLHEPVAGCGADPSNSAVSFSDAAPPRKLCGATARGWSFRPQESLSQFHGLTLDSSWTLRCGGSSLVSWGLTICHGNPQQEVYGAGPTSLPHDTNAASPNIQAGANDFGEVATFGASSSRTFVIRNEGDGAMRLDDISVVDPTSVFVITSAPTLPLLLGPQEEVQFTIVFDPTSGVVTLAHVLIEHNDFDIPSPRQFFIRGEGTVANLVVLDILLNPIVTPAIPDLADGTDFGGVNVLTTAMNSFFLRNDGNAPIDDLSVTLVGDPEFAPPAPPSSTLCDSCQIGYTVSFTPSTDALFTSSIEISYTAGGGLVMISVALRGLGAAPNMVVRGGAGMLQLTNNQVSISPFDGTDFGAVLLMGGVEAHTFVIENSGAAPLGVNSVTVEIGSLHFQVTSSPTVVAPTSSEVFVVEYDPSTTSCGLRDGRILIDSNDPTNSLFRFAVQGDILDNAGPIIMPTANVFATALNGACSASGLFSGPPTATDDCNGATITSITPSLYWLRSYPVGVTTITIDAVDGIGNPSSVSFTVTVDDPDPPSISCPDDLVTSKCRRGVRYLTPLAADNCGAEVELTSGLPSGSLFPVGVTTNQFTATDGGGLQSTCVFTVTVVDEGSCSAEEFSSRIDYDGDGFTAAEGDCCEFRSQCPFPYMVNPGAVDIPNGFDDDCNGRIDDYKSCSLRVTQLDVASTQGLVEHIPRGLGVCSIVEDSNDPSFGYLWTRRHHPYLSLADGTTIESPSTLQSSIVTKFGGYQSQDGSMLMLSSGAARAPNDAGYVDTNMDFQRLTRPPLEWLQGVPGGQLPYAPSCGATPVQTVDVLVFDGIRFHMDIRHPSNMRGFALDVVFGGQQPAGRYPPADPCELENDFLTVLTNAKGAPRDLNIARDSGGEYFCTMNQREAFWEVCSEFSQVGHCRKGSTLLRGTEYDGATDWHTVGVNAEPRSQYWLDIGIFDGGTPLFDSFVLADNFRFVLEERTDATYGPSRLSDIAITRLRASPATLRAGSDRRVVVSYVIRNSGPHPAGDIFLSFTPPQEMSIVDLTGDISGPCDWLPESVLPTQQEVMYRCNNPAVSIAPGGAITGQITLLAGDGLSGMVNLHFLASTSSVDDFLANNYEEVSIQT